MPLCGVREPSSRLHNENMASSPASDTGQEIFSPQRSRPQAFGSSHVARHGLAGSQEIRVRIPWVGYSEVAEALR